MFLAQGCVLGVAGIGVHPRPILVLLILLSMVLTQRVGIQSSIWVSVLNFLIFFYPLPVHVIAYHCSAVHIIITIYGLYKAA